MNPEAIPATANVFGAALDWLQATLLGSVATAVAVIVIATFGLLMFSGRVPARRAIEVVLGCFIIFGASAISSGIMHSFDGTGPEPSAVAALPPPPVTEAPVQKLPAQPYDPYAGAALPPRQ
ncbi:MAG: TrbC/VirB2 family protein [Sphingomicrobium sp.]